MLVKARGSGAIACLPGWAQATGRSSSAERRPAWSSGAHSPCQLASAWMSRPASST